MLGSNRSLSNGPISQSRVSWNPRAKLTPLPATLTVNKWWFLQLLVLSVNMMGKDQTYSAHCILICHTLPSKSTEPGALRAGKKSINWVTFLSWTTLNLLQTGGMSVEAACKQSVQFHDSEVRTASAPLVFKKTIFSKILIHHGDSQIPKLSTRLLSFLP